MSGDPASSVRIPAVRIPVQARSQRARAAIVAAARREFEERGYAETTARTIADAAGVGTGTFYRYFQDKDAVLREIALERSTYWRDASAERAEIAAKTPGVPSPETVRRSVASVVKHTISYHRTDRGLHAVIAERRLCDPELDELLVSFERDMVRGTMAALARTGRKGDTEAAAVMFFSLLEGAIHTHVLGKPFISDERFVEGLVDALFRLAVPGTQLSVARGARKS